MTRLSPIYLEFEELVFGSRQPWLEDLKSEDYFKSNLLALRPLDEENSAPQFAFTFESPFNNRTRYYEQFLLRMKDDFIRAFRGMLKNDLSDFELHYLKKDILERKLKKLIAALGKVIDNKSFNLDILDGSKNSYIKDQVYKSNTFIIQYLKLTLIHIYLEIQESILPIIDFPFEELDFYNSMTFETHPNKLFLERIQKLEIETTAKSISKKKKTSSLEYHSFTYLGDLYGDRFKDFHDALLKNGYISVNISTLRKIFSGKKIETPIRWLKNLGDLTSLIKIIHDDLSKVNRVYPQHWNVTVKCFLQEDGSPIIPVNIKTRKPTPNHDLIRSIASHL
ncbi:hypothetical protein [uncultured Arcticibacterium sp.]|uniref:hypothetical protein n=1 Tax=uncultured Arcticibacterium sp. TaxID=2173042 RepID=UPI0030F9567A